MDETDSYEALVDELPDIAYDSVRSQKLRDNIRYSSKDKEDSGLLAIAGALATFPVVEGAKDWKVHVVSPHVLELTFSNDERYRVSVMELPKGK